MRETSSPSHLILTGMMGTGKSTVGVLLANALNRSFIDLDAVIESRAGKIIPEIFREFGEPTFRLWEHEALVESLHRDDPAVIALGGGAVLDSANRALIRRHQVVWLDADVKSLYARVESEGRPLLAGNARLALARIAEERQNLYREVSLVRIDTTDLYPEGVKAAVIRWLDGEGEKLSGKRVTSDD